MTAAAALPPTARGALWMIGAIVSFVSMAIAGREVGAELDTFEIMLYRSLAGIAIVLAAARATGTLDDIRARRMGLHGLRNAAHFTGQNLWFYAITAIPLAQVFALEFTLPVWAILLAPLVLGEAITRRGLTAAGVGFVGILVVARPSPEAMSPGLVAAALAAVGFALSALFTRRLTRTEKVVSILFWLTVMQAGLGLATAGIDGDIAVPSAAALPWLAVISVAGLVAHFCLTTALSLAPASVVMPIDFVRLPLIAVIGILLYAEPLDPFVFLGGALIVAANWYNLAGPKALSFK